MREHKERLPRELIAMRIAAEFTGGEVVNLGIGIPTLVADFTPPEKGVRFHTDLSLDKGKQPPDEARRCWV